MLLAENPADLATSLGKIIQEQEQSVKYPQIIWLGIIDPLWNTLPSKADVAREKQRIERVLSPQFQLIKTEKVAGTMSLDELTIKLYQRSAGS